MGETHRECMTCTQRQWVRASSRHARSRAQHDWSRVTVAHYPVGSWHAVAGCLGGLGEDALWRARHCLAATVAHAMKHLPWAVGVDGGRGRDGRCLLWIVGAREALEGELARGGFLAQALCQLCPRSRGWEIVLIGPEMQTWEMEPTSDGACMRACSGTLHSMAEASVAPDLAVMGNSGIGTLLWPLVEQWLPTVLRLLELDVPLLCTCYNAREAEGERVVLQGCFRARLLASHWVNPLCHPIPLDTCARGNVDEQQARRLAESAVADNAAAAATVTLQTHRPTPENVVEGAAEETAEGTDGSWRPDTGMPARAEGVDVLGGAEGARVAWRRAASSTPHADRATIEMEDSTVHPVSHRWLAWLRGSSISPDEMRLEALPRARELVCGCAKVLAIKNMDACVASGNRMGGVGPER